MAKIPRVPVENEITTLSVVKIDMKFSPCTVNLPIFCEMTVVVIKFEKYLLQNCKSGLVIAWKIWKVFENTCTELKFEIKFYKFMCVS